jgi:hypothetical protein
MRIVAVVLLLAGCHGMLRAVRRQASFELRCPIEQTFVTDLGGQNFGVNACGQQLMYECWEAPFAGLHCTPHPTSPPPVYPPPSQ